MSGRAFTMNESGSPSIAPSPPPNLSASPFNLTSSRATSAVRGSSSQGIGVGADVDVNMGMGLRSTTNLSSSWRPKSLRLETTTTATPDDTTTTPAWALRLHTRLDALLGRINNLEHSLSTRISTLEQLIVSSSSSTKPDPDTASAIALAVYSALAAERLEVEKLLAEANEKEIIKREAASDRRAEAIITAVSASESATVAASDRRAEELTKTLKTAVSASESATRRDTALILLHAQLNAKVLEEWILDGNFKEAAGPVTSTNRGAE